MRVLGLDISSKITGWSIIEKSEDEKINLIAFGEIDLQKFKKKSNPLEYVKILYDSVSNIILAYNPDMCYCEDIFSSFNVLTFKSLSRMRGICELACLNNNIIKIFSSNASAIRKTVLGEGKGGMKSPEICTIMEDMFGVKLATPGLDQSDATLIGLYGVKLNGNPQTNVKRKSRTAKSSNGRSKKTK